jgi:hypothetical protein
MHWFSPLLFCIYVECIKKIPPIPKNKIMLTCRKYHNITLSIYSGFSFLSTLIITYKNDKYNSMYDLICKPYEESSFVYFIFYTFLYSKYFEWGDTLYLHLSGKKISKLQYTHHMTTAFLTSFAMGTHINPGTSIAVLTNLFVHTPMYWYFAYPKGILQHYKKSITQIQILQHITMLYFLINIMINKNETNCIYNPYSNEIALSLYFMYLLFFLSFYIFKY